MKCNQVIDGFETQICDEFQRTCPSRDSRELFNEIDSLEPIAFYRNTLEMQTKHAVKMRSFDLRHVTEINQSRFCLKNLQGVIEYNFGKLNS